MKQIILSTYRKETTNSLVGKIIKGISFIHGSYENDPQLIITFTDDTYIFLKAVIDDNDPCFENGYVESGESPKYLPGAVCIDENGNVTYKYSHYITEQIRLGIIKPDSEKELTKIKEYEEYCKKRDYELYLELKRKLNIDESTESLIKEDNKSKNKVKFFVKALADKKYHLYIEDKNGNFMFIGTHVDFDLLGLDIKDFVDMKEGQLREVYLNLGD